MIVGKVFCFSFKLRNVCHSGEIVVNTDPLMAETVTGSNSSEGSGDDITPFELETELVFNETQVVLFLFTDAGQMASGFNVSYW